MKTTTQHQRSKLITSNRKVAPKNKMQTDNKSKVALALSIYSKLYFGISILLLFVINTSNGQCVAIGDHIQGGIVFYVDNTGRGGLVAAPNDLPVAIWGCNGTLISGANGTALGTGLQNSNDIIGQCAVAAIAADNCRSSSDGGYTDWYLPSLDELNLLYAQKAAVGGFLQTTYWSSSQINSHFAYYKNFNSGIIGNSFQKNWGWGVRAIRSFSNVCANEQCNILYENYNVNDNPFWSSIVNNVPAANDISNPVSIQGQQVLYNDVEGNRDDRIFRPIPTLPNTWVAEFDFMPTGGSNIGVAASLFCVTSGTLTPYRETPTGTYTNQDFIEVGISTPLNVPNYLTATSVAAAYKDGATIPVFSPNIAIPTYGNTYYVRLERVNSRILLSIFSNANRTIHIQGSPVILCIPDTTTISGLNTLQHANVNQAGAARRFSGTLDNTCIKTGPTTNCPFNSEFAFTTTTICPGGQITAQTNTPSTNTGLALINQWIFYEADANCNEIGSPLATYYGNTLNITLDPAIFITGRCYALKHGLYANCIPYCATKKCFCVLAPDTRIKAGNDTTICSNTTFTLSALQDADYTYQWFQLPSNNLISNSNTATVTLNASANYRLRALSNCGFVIEDTIHITVIACCNSCSNPSNLTPSLVINTGYNETTNSAIGIGQQETNWKLVQQPTWSSLSLPANPYTIYYNPFDNPNFFPFPNSQWIAPDASGQSANNVNNFPFTFEYAFCLCQDDTVTFDFHTLGDDYLDIYVDNYATYLNYQSLTNTGQQAGQGNHFYKVFLTKGKHTMKVDLKNAGGPLGFDIGGTISGNHLLKHGLCDENFRYVYAGADKTIFTGSSTSLTAAGCTGNLQWYEINAGVGSPISGGNTPTITVSPSSSKCYYVACCDVNNCCVYDTTCVTVNSWNCPGNIIQNGGFSNGINSVGNGSIYSNGAGSQVSNWTAPALSAINNSPQIANTSGCYDNGYILMWGNATVSEAIQQNLLTPFKEGHVYQISYCARKSNFNQPYGDPFVRFLFRASNAALTNNSAVNSTGVRSEISGTTNNMNVSSTDWATYTTPACWVADADYSRLTVSINTNQTQNDGNYVSYGNIDNICVTECPCDVVANAGADTAICPGAPITLRGNVIAGATYEWKKIGTTTVLGTQRTLIINPTANTCYILKVTTAEGCFRKDTVCITMLIAPPAAPGIIFGPAKFCPGDTVCFSIPATARAMSYSWVPPIGMTLISGLGTTQVCYSISSLFIGGSLTVVAINSCGTSAARTLAVSRNNPTQPVVITGPSAFCPGDTVCFSIPLIANATGYTWTPPFGINIISGLGTTTICCSISMGFTGGALSVVATNGCGSSTARTKAVSRHIPVTPLVINGSDTFCPGDTVCFSVPTVVGISNYIWVAPAGMTILSGAGTSTICFIVNQSYAGGIISVAATNGCASSTMKTKSIYRGNPATPGVIAGPVSNLCGITSANYTVVPVPNATSYTWATPSGSTIVSGQGTNAIVVNFSGVNSANGVISVIASNPCGNSGIRTLNLTSLVGAPATPSAINGPVNVCSLSTATYSVTAVFGVTYSWILRPGMINPVYNSNGNAVTVTIDNSVGTAMNGYLKVNANNTCASSAASQLWINYTPATPGAISGPIKLCGLSTATYSVASISSASIYNWTFPAGFNPTVLSTASNILTVGVTPNANIAGNVTVTTQNFCGLGVTKTLAVNSVPSALGAIMGETSVCAGSSATYSVTPLPDGGITYTWGTTSSTATLGAANGNPSMLVNFASNFVVKAQVTVYASNACTSNATKGMWVYRKVCAAPIIGTNNQTDEAISANLFNVHLYPNPTASEYNIEFISDDDIVVIIELYDVLGNKVQEQQQTITAGSSILSATMEPYGTGVYLIRITNKEGKLLYKNNLLKQ